MSLIMTPKDDNDNGVEFISQPDGSLTIDIDQWHPAADTAITLDPKQVDDLLGYILEAYPTPDWE